jgi:hypothetical protein
VRAEDRDLRHDVTRQPHIVLGHRREIKKLLRGLRS